VADYRRQKQLAYNHEAWDHARSVVRAVEESLSSYRQTTDRAQALLNESGVDIDLSDTIRELNRRWWVAANNLEFEKAALLRDQVKELKRTLEGSKTTKPIKLSKAAAAARNERTRWKTAASF